MSLLDRLQALSSAEDFFALLDVPYDEAVVRVARLHILRRMGQYLRGSEAEGAFDGLDEVALQGLCRAHLAQAYADFVASSPIDQRVFKVLKDAVAQPAKPAPAFVSLSVLK